MGRSFLIALMMWALCFSGTDCGSAKVQGPQSSQVKTAESPVVPAVTLTAEHPIRSLPVGAEVLTSGSEVLEVTITKVVNPSMTPVSVFVSLSDAEKGASEPRPIPVGNFSLYPPDQGGKFLLSVKSALSKVSDATAKGHEVRLVFEMKRIHETKAWTPVELTIAQPVWRAAEE